MSFAGLKRAARSASFVYGTRTGIRAARRIIDPAEEVAGKAGL
jgi:hypothetical protein